MDGNEKKREEFNSSNLVIFLYKWRKPLLVVMVAALAGSWFFSLPWFITPKFKSTVVVPGQHRFDFQSITERTICQRPGPGGDRGAGTGRTTSSDPELKQDPGPCNPEV
jgi:hypothetical protein